MAEQKKKPTPRKAPKGGLSAQSGTEGKAQRKAVKEALAESDAQEKAAAKEAIAHAKEASKERKAERKAAAKAEKTAAKEAAKEARAEKKSQRKASRGKEKEPAMAPNVETEEAEVLSEEDFGDALGAGDAARTVRFVSGEDAYRAPAPGSHGASSKRAGAGRRVRWGRVFGIVIGALLAVIVVVAAVFSWNRWLRYDDAADFQGTWTYGEGGALSVTFDGSTMTLTKDAAYGYGLDTFSKTVTYRFGDLSGSGCYAFSEDRNTLVIVDGRSADVGSILGLVDIAQDASVENDGTSSVIVLSRAGAASTAPSAGETAPSSSETARTSDSAPGQAAAQESSSTESSKAPAEEGAGSSTAGEGQTDQDIEALGEDPGSEAGANVVTPEDLGISSSEMEKQ